MSSVISVASVDITESDFGVDPRALANFILDTFEERGILITNLSLQKYMYFCHGWCWAQFDRALIDREFEAWPFGQVSRLVYSKFSAARRRTITTRAHIMTPLGATSTVVPHSFSAAMTVFLRHVLEKYWNLTAFQLSNLTHDVGSPWWRVRYDDEFERIGQSKIPDNLVAAWFKESADISKQ